MEIFTSPLPTLFQTSSLPGFLFPLQLLSRRTGTPISYRRKLEIGLGDKSCICIIKSFLLVWEQELPFLERQQLN